MAKQNMFVKVLAAGAAIGAVAYVATRVKTSVFGEENIAKQLNLENGELRIRITQIDRTSLFRRRARAPDKSTVKRRFHAFHVAPRS